MDGSSEGKVDRATKAEVWELFTLLLQASDAVTRARQSELREVGATMMQLALLFIVKFIKGTATPAEISRWLFRKRHTVSALLKHMEKQGLVARTKDLPKKGMIRVSVTEEGEKLFRQAIAKREAVPEIMSCLSQEERANFSAYLRRVRDEALGHIGVSYRLPYP